MSQFSNLFYTYIESSIEILIMLLFFIRFLGTKIKKPALYPILAIPGLMIPLLTDDNTIQLLLLLLYLSGTGICICRTDRLSVLLYAVITVEIMQLCYGISASLSHMLSSILISLSPKTLSLIFMIGGSMLALLLSVLCYFIISRHFLYDTTASGQYALPLLMPVLLIFIISEYIRRTIYGSAVIISPDENIMQDNACRILLTQLAGLCSLFCILYSYKRLLDSFQLKMKLSLLEQEHGFLRQYVAEARTRYEITKSFRHDVKNHMTIVRALLQKEGTKQALAYLDDMEQIGTDMSFPCNTNNPVVDVLLENKLGIAENNGIHVSCTLRLPMPCEISDMDLCIIFANALDNAIHACNQCAAVERFIRITGSLQGDFLLLDMQNSIDETCMPQEGTGLKNMKAVVQKYNGAMHIQTEKHVFILSILLIIPHQSQDISPQKH